MPRTTIRTEDITASEVTTAKMATDPTNASNLSSGAVPLAQLGNAPATDTTDLKDDIAILGFKTQANGSLAKYNLSDQTVDSFEDASGIDASASTNEIRDSSNYYSGAIAGAYTIDAYTDASGTGAHTKTFAAGTTEAEILIVAGGGAGHGSYYGGGGGAGGIVYDADYAITALIEYDITVGDKGVGVYQAIGSSGEDSVFNVNAEGSGITLTAKGGGKAGDWDTVGTAGGSGGAGADGAASNQADFSGAVSYGNAGGSGTSTLGGGGGASAVGADGVADSGRAGAGGAGQLFSTFVAYGTDSSNVASTGSNGGYFGGGGGGAGGGNADLYGYAGVGGGGIGGQYAGGSPTAPTSAIANTGGGGGGSSHNTGRTGGDGGEGVVLIRSRPYGFNDMTLISTSTTAQSVPTKGDLVMTYTDGIGTATINTDIKAYVSRDDGSNYTQGTLASQGTTGGHTILTFHDLDISGQPSGTTMRYKIETLNQDTDKATRIQAVSLGWS